MTYKLSDNTPGIFSIKQMDELEDLISLKTKEIELCSSPRLIVIEAWFIIDWFIRQFIISGIDCFDLVSDKYNPHYQLLPNSFRECIDILKELIESQKKLKPKPKPFNDYLSGSMELWDYIKEKSPYTFKKVKKLSDEFRRGKYKIPKEEAYIFGAQLDPKKESYRFVTEKWLNSISRIDKKWISLALKLNKARNNAAHSLNEESLFEPFGIKGNNRLDKLRKECLFLLTTSIGLIEVE